MLDRKQQVKADTQSVLIHPEYLRTNKAAVRQCIFLPVYREQEIQDKAAVK